MMLINKRLKRSLSRIINNGKTVVVHHKRTGGIAYQLLNGRGVSTGVVECLLDSGHLVSNGDGLLPECPQTLKVATHER